MNDTRKRQRRQAAGALVSGLFGGGAAGAAGGSGTGAGGNGTGGAAPSPPTTADSPGAGMNNDAAHRKSTAQPRPSIRIPPRGIGPVYDPNENDVLCGRGGRINAHSGNVQFRELVLDRKKDYLAKETKKLEKAHIAAGIVKSIRDMQPAGRFLKEDADGTWFDIGDHKAIKKVGQALREDAPDIRHETDGLDDTNKEAADYGGDINGNGNNGTQQQRPVLTVSGRGGSQAGRAPQQQPQQSSSSPSDPHYQPIAYQHLPTQPSYQPIVPPQPTTTAQQQPQTHHRPGNNVGMRGMIAKGNAAFSGAAAAVMGGNRNDDDDVFAVPHSGYHQNLTPQEIAFGRTFHPHERDAESSMISGIGSSLAPTMLSGMSGISALTDPMSTLSGAGSTNRGGGRGGGFANYSNEALRMSQLNQLRQQWAEQHYAGSGAAAAPASSEMSTSRMLLSNSQAGLGASFQRSLSLKDVGSNVSGDVSWGGHSLIGGGLRDDSALGGGGGYSGGGGGASVFSGYSGMQSVMMQSVGESTVNSATIVNNLIKEGNNTNRSISLNSTTKDGSNSTIRSKSSGSRSTTRQQNIMGGPNNLSGSTAMSINSGGGESLPSMSGSLMSDLSENLVALDLAESSLLGPYY